LASERFERSARFKDTRSAQTVRMVWLVQ